MTVDEVIAAVAELMGEPGELDFVCGAFAVELPPQCFALGRRHRRQLRIIRKHHRTHVRIIPKGCDTVPAPPAPALPITQRRGEIAFHHTPSNAHGTTWNGNTDQQITMYVEQSHGIDVFGVGISSPIEAHETPAGRVFAATDAGDDTFVQAGLVVDGQVINFEARNVPIDEVMAMAASVATASDAAWASRVPG